MATIQIDSQRVQKACENFIAKRKLRIEREREALIKRHVGRRTHWFFGPKHTYESAKAMLMSDQGLRSPWFRIEWSGCDWQSEAEQLLALACLGNPVTLTEKDVWIMEYENDKP